MLWALGAVGVGIALWIGGAYIGRNDKKMGGMYALPGLFVTVISAIVFLFLAHWLLGVFGLLALVAVGYRLYSTM